MMEGLKTSSVVTLYFYYRNIIKLFEFKEPSQLQTNKHAKQSVQQDPNYLQPTPMTG